MTIKTVIYRLFDQLTYMLENINNDQYANQQDILNQASIGQHVRHTLEFFSCLLQGIPTGVINYDKRKRDIFLENNTLEALTLIQSLKSQINSLDENTSIVLTQTYSEENDPLIEIQSNIDRELVYNIEHAVHHMALIRIGLRAVTPSLALPEEFGVASSTIRHRHSQPSA